MNDAQQAIAYDDLPKKSKKSLALGIVALVIALGGASIAGWYYLAKDNAPTAQTPPPILVVTPAHDTPPLVNHTPPVAPTDNPSPVPITNPPAAPDNTMAEQLVYTDAAWHFSFLVPSSWNIQIAELTPTTKVLYNPIDGIVYGQIDRSTAPDTTTLDMVTQQLAQSSDVAKVERTTFANLPALLAQPTKGSTPIIAVIYNQSLYYISGDLALDPIRATWKFN